MSVLRVFLDDDTTSANRQDPEGFVRALTAWDAIRLLDTGQVVELSLDHDLGDDEVNGTGSTVVDFICEQQVVHGRDLWPRDGITLHTANSHGRDVMQRAIMRYAGQLHRCHVTVRNGSRHITFS
jgi:hypothetical protein